MIASLVILVLQLKGNVKEPVTSRFETELNGVGDVRPEVMVYLTCVLIGLGGRGVIKTSTKVAEGVPAFTC